MSDKRSTFMMNVTFVMKDGVVYKLNNQNFDIM